MTTENNNKIYLYSITQIQIQHKQEHLQQIQIINKYSDYYKKKKSEYCI